MSGGNYGYLHLYATRERHNRSHRPSCFPQNVITALPWEEEETAEAAEAEEGTPEALG